MSDVPGVSHDQKIGGPTAPGDKWLSFELRMRRRRTAKCLQRADLAIQNGAIHAARNALDEARLLDPDCPDLATLEQRWRALQRRGQGSVVRLISARRLPAAPVTAIVVLIFAAVVFGANYWFTSPSTGPSPATTATVDTDAVANAGAAAAPPVPDRLEIVHETVTAPVATPRIVEDLPGFPLGQPIGKASPKPATPVVVAVNRRPPAPAAHPVSIPEPPAEIRLEPLPPPSAPANSTSRIEVAEPRPARAETRPAEEPVAPVEPESRRDELSVVLGVLQQYELAYSSLDAAAAAAVWPRVNRNALARAFDGLASQRVSLGRCDVAVNGPAARATCSGSATWEPKVGGGQRTEPRRWNFELRKTGGGWRIERAVAGQ